MHSTHNPPAYLATALQVRDALTQTMQQAIATLPASVKTQQWMAAKHSPASWRSVEHWYMGKIPRDRRVLNTLTNLALLSDALACVQSVTEPRSQAEERPLDLTLKKVKRVEL